VKFGRFFPQTEPTSQRISVLLLSIGNSIIGFGVDDILEEREVIVKPLGKNFQNARHLLGGTILGRGQVVLVLDIVNIADSLTGVAP